MPLSILYAGDTFDIDNVAFKIFVKSPLLVPSNSIGKGTFRFLSIFFVKRNCSSSILGSWGITLRKPKNQTLQHTPRMDFSFLIAQQQRLIYPLPPKSLIIRSYQVHLALQNATDLQSVLPHSENVRATADTHVRRFLGTPMSVIYRAIYSSRWKNYWNYFRKWKLYLLRFCVGR